MKIRRADDNRWTLEDAPAELGNLLLDVQQFGPQEIEVDGAVYCLTKVDESKRVSAKSYLARGGPNNKEE